MFTVFAVTPVTIPEEEPTVAVPVLLLLQVPPLVLHVSVVVLPSHTAAVPLIAAGELFTTIVSVVKQPALRV